MRIVQSGDFIYVSVPIAWLPTEDVPVTAVNTTVSNEGADVVEVRNVGTHDAQVWDSAVGKRITLRPCDPPTFIRPASNDLPIGVCVLASSARGTTLRVRTGNHLVCLNTIDGGGA